MTVFLGTLWSYIKKINAPYVFDGEHGISLHAMQGNKASSGSEGEVSRFFSRFFSRCGGNLGYILELRRGWPFKALASSLTSGLLSNYEGHVRNLLEASQANTDVSRGEAGDQGSLSSYHSDNGIPINFQEESDIITF